MNAVPSIALVCSFNLKHFIGIGRISTLRWAEKMGLGKGEPTEWNDVKA